MNDTKSNLPLGILAIFTILLWNYPLIASVLENSSVWIKILYFFGTWLAIVVLTRKWTRTYKQE